MCDKRSRILIVDDERSNINVLNEILKDRHSIKVALNGEQTLERAVSHPKPDLILLDIVMPGMDGFEVCRKLKENKMTADTPVVFISALHETIDKVKAFSLGAVDYITKPFDAEEVLARVKTHLTLHFLQQQLKKKNQELQLALTEIKTLRGILPICSSCKKIRNDKGYWEQIECYISEHSDAEFSHGLCQECAKKLYPDMFDENGDILKPA